MLLSMLLKLSTLFHLGKMDKRIRPFEDIAPLNVRYRLFLCFEVSDFIQYKPIYFIVWFNRRDYNGFRSYFYNEAEMARSMVHKVNSWEPFYADIHEPWKDPRMMFPDIEGEKMLDNKTILTMDLKFLEELWVPGKLSYNFWVSVIQQ